MCFQQLKLEPAIFLPVDKVCPMAGALNTQPGPGVTILRAALDDGVPSILWCLFGDLYFRRARSNAHKYWGLVLSRSISPATDLIRQCARRITQRN
jgi:hypothetical protein